MRPFSELEAGCTHPIREVIGDPIREKMLGVGNPIDIDSPIGANDSIGSFCAFFDGELMFIEYNYFPDMVGF